MAEDAPVTHWSMRISEGDHRRLFAHLFPGDGDEHGAVLLVGTGRSRRGTRLLVREVLLAEDGIDYVPGVHGYRMLRASFIQSAILRARDEGWGYLAVHNHGGVDRVGFSGPDIESHERGYPALRAISRGQLVGALVVAENAIAGDLWLPGGGRAELWETVIVGRNVRRLYREPPQRGSVEHRYDRQVRLFGDRGQEMLASARVGIVGAGGVGSLLIEYLSRLGVGELVVIDPDRVDPTNLPRVVDATRLDALDWFRQPGRPAWLRALAARLARPKVAIARRVARRASPRIRVEGYFRNVVEPDVATALTDCDYIFLAADTMQARLVVNAIVHQYLIPAAVMGAKVLADPDTGELTQVFSAVRFIAPDRGCLLCNGLISASGLQEEATPAGQRERQRYVNDPEVIAPSVITLNAVAASYAANDFLISILDLHEAMGTHDYVRFHPRTDEVWVDEPRQDPACSECGFGETSRVARGDGVRLPILLPTT